MSWGKVAARGQGGKQQQSEQKSCAETGWGRRSLTLAHSVCAEEERPGKSARPGKASRVLPVRRRSRCAARPSRCAALPGAPPFPVRRPGCAAFPGAPCAVLPGSCLPSRVRLPSGSSGRCALPAPPAPRVCAARPVSSVSRLRMRFPSRPVPSRLLAFPLFRPVSSWPCSIFLSRTRGIRVPEGVRLPWHHSSPVPRSTVLG